MAVKADTHPIFAEQEEWRDIPGFEWYQASDLGRIKSKARIDRKGSFRRERVMNFGKSKDGYLKGVLYSCGNRVPVRQHRIVALAFLGECPEGYHCCHINGNPSDNRLSNLRYASPKENMADKVTHGTMAMGEKLSSLSEEDVRNILSLKGMATSKDVASAYNLSRECVLDIFKGRTWKSVYITTDAASRKGFRAGSAHRISYQPPVQLLDVSRRNPDTRK